MLGSAVWHSLWLSKLVMGYVALLLLLLHCKGLGMQGIICLKLPYAVDSRTSDNTVIPLLPFACCAVGGRAQADQG